MIFKELTVEELRKDYVERKGFVFKADSECSDESIDKLAEAVITKKYSKELPEFVTKLPNHIYVFVYGDDFDTAGFYQRAFFIAGMTGHVQVETLYNALK